MFEKHKTEESLRTHVKTLTEDIGERSVVYPQNLIRAQKYIESCYRDIGLTVRLEPYPYGDMTVSNVVADISFGRKPEKRFLIGAHYDSVAGTVGADDNASAVAVQLETAKQIYQLKYKLKYLIYLNIMQHY